MMDRLGQFVVVALLVLLAGPANSQVIEFESGGLKYQTLTKEGLTVMFAHLPTTIRNYRILQVAVSNGSTTPAKVTPLDFQIELSNGSVMQAVPPTRVVNELIRNASGDDVIKMVSAYELSLYGLGRRRLTNGYERRRQAALAVVSSRGLKAAAAASAIALVETELRPGESTDGAVFYPSTGRTVEQAKLRVHAGGQLFEFEPSSTPELTR